MGGRARQLKVCGAAAAVALLGSVVTAAPASASIGWDDGALLVPTGSVEDRRPQVVVDSEGDRHVVYDDENADVWLVEAGEDGTAGAPVQLFAADDDRFGGYPRVAIDDADRLTVVWYVTDRSQERRSHIVSRTVSADGELGDPQVLSDLDDNAYYPEVAVDSTGVATVVWENEIGGGWPGKIEARRLTPGSGTPSGAIITVDDPGGEVPDGIGVADATVEVDSAGRAVVAWTRFDGDLWGNGFRSATVRAMRLGADGTPGPVQPVSNDPTTQFRYPKIAIAPGGTVTIVTTRFSAVAETVATRFAAADFTPGDPVLVSAPKRESWDDAAVTVDGSGRVTVAWFAGGRNGVQLEVRRLAADGQPEERRAPLGLKGGILARMELIAMASDDQGRVTVAWPGADGRRARMHAVRIDESGHPSTTQRLSSPGGPDAFEEVIDAAVDAEGRVSVVWSRYGASALRRTMAPAAGLVPTDTTILRGPRGGRVVTDRTPRFRFEAGTLEATFQCRLDDRRWRACTSPMTTPKLSSGRHRLEVRAVDADGTPPDRTPAVARFRVR